MTNARPEISATNAAEATAALAELAIYAPLVWTAFWLGAWGLWE